MAVKHGLPLSVTQILSSGEWKGGRLIQLEDDTTRPTANDLVINFWWVRPFVMECREQVPSGFFCTDVFLYLHELFNNELFKVAAEGDTVKSLAAQEGNDMKRLIGALRSLWRSSQVAAFMAHLLRVSL